MPKIYSEQYFREDLEVPEEFLAHIMAAPRLLPGERIDDYYACVEAMIGEILPDIDSEWLLTIDCAWIAWEIQRYRGWKNAIIAINQRAAIADALIKSDPQHLVHDDIRYPRKRLMVKVDSINGDWAKDQDLKAQLVNFGYDNDALNATAFLEAAPSLAVIEKFLTSGRAQLTGLLREAAVRREVKLRTQRLNSRLLAEERAARKPEKGEDKA